MPSNRRTLNPYALAAVPNAVDIRRVLIDLWELMMTNDYYRNVSMGDVRNEAALLKFGEAETVTAGAGEIELWDGSAAYSWPTSALMTSMSQTADQAALRGANVYIEGLDTNWAFVAQTKALNASNTTTVVTLDTALIRCFRAEIQANVVTNSPVRIHNAGETQDYAVIAAGENQTLMAIYTVPSGKTLLLTHAYCSVNKGGGAPTSLKVRLRFRDNVNTYAPKTKWKIGLDEDATSYAEKDWKPYYKVTQKTDIYFTGEATGANASVAAGFDGILVTN